jgi:hypothetical protein
MTTRGKQVQVTEIAYLAGMLDADGCISISKAKPDRIGLYNPRYVLTVNVTNADEDLMRWLVERFGGNYKHRQRVSERHRQTFNWWFNNGKALNLLRLVRPYLRVKVRQTDHGIAFLEGWVKPKPAGPGTQLDPAELKRREAFYLEMKRLNQTGCAAATTKSLGPCLVQQGDAIV